MYRSLPKTIRGKKVCRPRFIVKILWDLLKTAHSDQSLVLLWLVLIFAFTGFLRASNLAARTISDFDSTRHSLLEDVQYVEGGLSLHIKWTKTLQEEEQETSVVLPRVKNRLTCPVRIWE